MAGSLHAVNDKLVANSVATALMTFVLLCDPKTKYWLVLFLDLYYIYPEMNAATRVHRNNFTCPSDYKNP